MHGRAVWKLHHPMFAGFKTRWGRVLSPRSLQCQVQKWNESWMNRPGAVFALKTKSRDKELSRKLGGLEEQAGAIFGEYQRHGIVRAEVRIVKNSNIHQ